MSSRLLTNAQKFSRRLQWLRDQEFLEETQARLLQELETARQAETYLDAQKVENLSLKETINRLRADLDELRLNSSGGRSPGGVSMSRSGSRKDASDDGTMGKSLEKELWRQLMAGKVEEGEEGDREESGGEESPPDGDDSYIETFITTSRRRVSPFSSSATVSSCSRLNLRLPSCCCRFTVSDPRTHPGSLSNTNRSPTFETSRMSEFRYSSRRPKLPPRRSAFRRMSRLSLACRRTVRKKTNIKERQVGRLLPSLAHILLES